MRRFIVAVALAGAACGSSTTENTPPTAATPSFSPSAGTYNAPQSVTITSATAGAAIHYTTDGSTPNASSATYSTAIAVAATTTLKAIATMSGYNDSAVGSATYTMLAATPVFSLAPGTYTTAQSVTITTATPGATIHYTTDGSTPTAASPAYASAIPLPGPGPTTTTLKAIAVRAGFTDSAVASATYTIDFSATPTETPTFSPAPGTYTSAQDVTISSTTAGAVIHCTTDGSTPTTGSPTCTTVHVAATTTIKAIATATGHTESAVATGVYTINLPQAATPTFSPAPGTYTSAQDVTISSTTAGAVIHCTTDGSTPTTGSPTCTTVHVAATTTVKAIATATGYTESAVATGVYTINLPQAATPTFSPAPGTYTSAQDVTISSTTAGAVIHCTTDGSTPTTGSPTCTTVHVAATTTVKAIATATNFAPSNVATGTYVISTGGGTAFLTACNAVLSKFQSLEEGCNQVNPALFSNPGPFGGGIDCAAIQKEITANLIVYSDTQGTTCVNDTQGLTCSSLLAGGGFTIPASCTGALTGQVATNGGCYSSNDCANGYCTSDYTATCPGTCQAFAASGAGCTSATCAGGLVCDHSLSTPTCQPAGSVGQACPCQPGLWCDTAATPNPVCKAPQTAGGACGVDPAACAVGYACVGFTVFPPNPGTCRALVGAGASCGADVCGSGYSCPAGTCVSWPSVGADCDPNQTPFCIGGYCDSTLAQPKCVAFKADGATCAIGLECASGYCNSSNHCAPAECTMP